MFNYIWIKKSFILFFRGEILFCLNIELHILSTLSVNNNNNITYISTKYQKKKKKVKKYYQLISLIGFIQINQ